MKQIFRFALLSGWLALGLTPGGFAQDPHRPDPVATSASGSISGNISNAGTGNLLEGARVELPQLGLSTLTDNTGRFVLNRVPPGTHEMVASYLGLDPIKAEVVVAAGRRATRDFDLTASIYQLQAFTVSSEREGGAAAITAQRNSPNVKNVVAMDTFGNLPNMSASELAIRLPGVAGNFNLEGGVDGMTIRGMGPGLNTITVDGALLSSQGGMQRTTRINNLTGAMFDQVELIKGHTPDKGADSLGGTLNVKSRSPLSMKEKRRITYNFAARWAPPFTQQTPLREAHRSHPLLNVAYQEVFDVRGGERNLGVAVNMFYSENVAGIFSTTRDFQDTLGSPAFVWDYRTMDQYNNRKQASVNVKLDYRLSPTTKLSLNTIYNDANEMGKLRYETRAFTNQNVGTTGTAGIFPGYTDRITRVRASTASNLDVTVLGPNNFFLRLRHADLGVEQEFGRLTVDYNALISQTHINNGNGDAGVLTNRINNVGWILDRTQSDLYPGFIQTEGRDFTDPANYRPNGFLTNANSENDHEIKELRGNARYQIPIRFETFLKTGFMRREQEATDKTRTRRWSYRGATALPTDPSVIPMNQLKTGRRIPIWSTAMFMKDRVPTDPTLWSEDLYFREQNQFTGTRGVAETVTAGYVMAQGRIGGTGWLTGVRTEKTDVESWGWVRARIPSTAAQQAADPVGSAQRDYAGTRRTLDGSYTKSFPSAHLTQDVTRNLKARLSWSTSFGRPAMTNFLPNETFNDTAQTLTINNPSLLPQTAGNWDASLDYYFEPVGNFSVGWFQKTIRDFIVTGAIVGTVGTGQDNGYNGEYGGYSLRTSSNAGTAFVQGWEFSYQQQFTFLPGMFKGLGVGANYTLLDTHGDFGGTATRKSGEVPGFIPRTANLSVFWRHRGFSSTVLVSYTGGYLTNYSAASAARNRYLYERTIINFGLAYQIRPALSLTCDVANLFNEPQSSYRGIPDRMENTNFAGTSITLGVGGRF